MDGLGGGERVRKGEKTGVGDVIYFTNLRKKGFVEVEWLKKQLTSRKAKL